jgi:hypothetical protein
MGARRWVWVLVTIACAWLSACSASTPRVKVMIEPAADANDELPCYLLIRAVDEKSFIADPYQTIADLVMSPDASVLQSAVIFPGSRRSSRSCSPRRGSSPRTCCSLTPTETGRRSCPPGHLRR